MSRVSHETWEKIKQNNIFCAKCDLCHKYIKNWCSIKMILKQGYSDKITLCHNYDKKCLELFEPYTYVEKCINGCLYESHEI